MPHQDVPIRINAFTTIVTGKIRRGKTIPPHPIAASGAAGTAQQRTFVFTTQ